MQVDKEKISDIETRLEQLEAKHPADVDAAKVLLSGTLIRQRIHWSQEIYRTDRFIIAGILAIWTFFIHSGMSDWTIGWASGISSLLLGLWRLECRRIDAAIAELYPAITRYELALGIPDEISTLRKVRQQYNTEENIRNKVKKRIIGSRAHLPYDWLALLLIITMAGATMRFGSARNLSCCDLGSTFHPFVLLLMNVAGFIIVIIAMNCFQTNKGGIRGLFISQK